MRTSNKYGFVEVDLPTRLKRRIAALVRGTDMTPETFMVDAIGEHTRLAEKTMQRRLGVAKVPAKKRSRKR